MESAPKVLAVIPTLGKNSERLERAVNSIRQLTSHKNLTVLIIDNSYEGNLNCGERVDEIFSSGINLGWVGSLEFARRNYDFDFLWSFQDDMTILNDVLSILLEEFRKNERLGVASPVSLIDGLIPAWTRGGKFINETKSEWTHIPESNVSPAHFVQDDRLCFVSSSGALWKKEALDDISGFDLSLYPANHVDTDACFRLSDREWMMRLVPNAHISHEVNGSTVGILSSFLYLHNKKFVISKFQGVNNNGIGNLANLDSDFLYSITRRSTYLFLEFAQFATERINELQNIINQLKNELEQRKHQA